ncbi:fimbrial protein [Lelliottia amnigena]
MLFIIVKANASIHGTHGLGTAAPMCPPHASESVDGHADTVAITPGVCATDSAAYVPASGYYSVISIADYYPDHKPGEYPAWQKAYYKTGAAYIDASKPINQQNITVSPGQGGTLTVFGGISLCAILVDASGTQYKIPEIYCEGSEGYLPPLPPTPPTPETSCTINGGNALSVSLGTLNRDEILTAPDSTSAINKTVSVNCTGSAVTVNMQMSYTPISIGSSQAVKTSAKGVGSAIFYGSKVLSPTDVTPVTFLEGSNSLTLGFQAVRDSTVALKDIPTGAFTANAVLVMTQQ